MNKYEKTELETETQKHESQMRSIYSQLVFWREYSRGLAMLRISEKKNLV